MRAEFGFAALERTGAIKRNLSANEIVSMAMTALKTYEPRVKFTRVDPETTGGIIAALAVHFVDNSGMSEMVRVVMPQ